MWDHDRGLDRPLYILKYRIGDRVFVSGLTFDLVDKFLCTQYVIFHVSSNFSNSLNLHQVLTKCRLLPLPHFKFSQTDIHENSK